jgi:hypothetical protein
MFMTPRCLTLLIAAGLLSATATPAHPAVLALYEFGSDGDYTSSTSEPDTTVSAVSHTFALPGAGTHFASHTGNPAKDFAFYGGGANTSTASKYLSFTVAPQAGASVTYDHFSFVGGSYSASANYSLRYVEGGNPEVTLTDPGNFVPSSLNNGNLALVEDDFADFSSTQPVEWRLYGYNTTASDHAVRLDDVTLQGSVSGGQPTVTTQFAMSDFTTASRRGDSPSTGGWTGSGPLFVRERANDANPEMETRAYLDFDLGGLGAMPIASATLKLHEFDKLNSVHSASLYLAKITDDWDSSTIPPSFGGTGVTDEFTFGNNGPASAGPSVDIYFDIDVTDIVKAWQADPASNYGFRLRIGDNFVGAAFDDTGPNAPVLLVTQLVPEPSTLAISALGLACLGFCRRRRKR